MYSLSKLMKNDVCCKRNQPNGSCRKSHHCKVLRQMMILQASPSAKRKMLYLVNHQGRGNMAQVEHNGASKLESTQSSLKNCSKSSDHYLFVGADELVVIG